ncbi:MAG: hypothetical protein AB7O59_06445 [Pirellulales bacterium]
MDQSERVELRDYCVVAYRHGARGIEFCLLSQATGNRWEFPTTPADEPLENGATPLHDVAAGVGLHGQLDDREPLDMFAAARGNQSRHVTAYLMHVTAVDENWPQRATHRRIWCLAEEARARLRRKPYRRFIDLALRCAATRSPAVNGRGPLGANSSNSANGASAGPRLPR